MSLDDTHAAEFRWARLAVAEALSLPGVRERFPTAEILDGSVERGAMRAGLPLMLKPFLLDR